MTWDAIGAVGEIVGALAVFATLVYLAKQIRVQNRATEMEHFENLMDGFNQFNALIAADKELYRIYMTGLNHPERLDDDDAGRFTALFRIVLNGAHKMMEAFEQGAVPEIMWRDIAAQTAQQWFSPGGQIFASNHPVHPAFHEAMVENLRQEVTIDFSLGRQMISRSGI